jgi:hypothetical protein
VLVAAVAVLMQNLLLLQAYPLAQLPMFHLAHLVVQLILIHQMRLRQHLLQEL